MTTDEALEQVIDLATDNCKYREPAGAAILRDALKALWAVRVLDALGRRLVKVHGKYTGGVSPCILQTGGGYSGHWLGCGNQPIGKTEDAARIAAATALVAADPSLDPGAK